MDKLKVGDKVFIKSLNQILIINDYKNGNYYLDNGMVFSDKFINKIGEKIK